MDEDRYPVIQFDAADIQKTCVMCRKPYFEIDNMGKWQCRQHHGAIVDGRFTCCNTKTTFTSIEQFYRLNVNSTIKGCVRCDHKTVVYAFDEVSGVARAPSAYVAVLGPQREATKMSTTTANIVLIYRYDVQTTERKKQQMNMHNLAQQGLMHPSLVLTKNLLIDEAETSKNKAKKL